MHSRIKRAQRRRHGTLYGTAGREFPAQSDLKQFVRTSLFTYLKPKHIVKETIQPGILKSLHLQGCESLHASLRSVLTIGYRYVLSVLLKKLFFIKCNLAVLRLTPLLTLLTLPFALTRLICYHKRIRPPSSIYATSVESVILSTFPVAWFFGFLYYTDVPSLLGVVLSIVAAIEGKHWLSALVRETRALVHRN
jgi:DIE2/ALG10 family